MVKHEFTYAEISSLIKNGLFYAGRQNGKIYNTEVFVKLLSAVEKQIPKKPAPNKDWHLYSCPNCNNEIINSLDDGKFPHCHLCGQALDWSATE